MRRAGSSNCGATTMPLRANTSAPQWLWRVIPKSAAFTKGGYAIAASLLLRRRREVRFSSRLIIRLDELLDVAQECLCGRCGNLSPDDQIECRARDAQRRFIVSGQHQRCSAGILFLTRKRPGELRNRLILRIPCEPQLTASVLLDELVRDAHLVACFAGSRQFQAAKVDA